MRETTKKNKLNAILICLLVIVTVFGLATDSSFAAAKVSSYERGDITSGTGWFEDSGSEKRIELGGKYFYVTQSEDGKVLRLYCASTETEKGKLLQKCRCTSAEVQRHFKKFAEPDSSIKWQICLLYI